MTNQVAINFFADGRDTLGLSFNAACDVLNVPYQDAKNWEDRIAQAPSEVSRKIIQLILRFSDRKHDIFEHALLTGYVPLQVYYPTDELLQECAPGLAKNFDGKASLHHGFLWNLLRLQDSYSISVPICLFQPEVYDDWLLDNNRQDSQESFYEWAIENIGVTPVNGLPSFTKEFIDERETANAQQIGLRTDREITAQMLIAGVPPAELIDIVAHNSPLCEAMEKTDARLLAEEIVSYLMEQQHIVLAIEEVAKWKESVGAPKENNDPGWLADNFIIKSITEAHNRYPALDNITKVDKVALIKKIPEYSEELSGKKRLHLLQDAYADARFHYELISHAKMFLEIQLSLSDAYLSRLKYIVTEIFPEDSADIDYTYCDMLAVLMMIEAGYLPTDSMIAMLARSSVAAAEFYSPVQQQAYAQNIIADVLERILYDEIWVSENKDASLH